MWDFIVAIVIGALIGWLASKVMNRDASMGALANIIVGIVGGALGRWLGTLMGIHAETVSLGGILISIAGACLLIFIIDLIRGRR